ncbi:MAG: CPBP family intramembrane glutamic endopeptidase [Saprospiraceae bacterium]
MIKKENNLSNIKLLLELIIVLGIVFSLKYFCLQYFFIGAGSIGIWGGIISATIILRKRSTSWGDLGLRLPKGGKQWIFQLGLSLIALVLMALVQVLTLKVLTPTFGLSGAGDVMDHFRLFSGKPIHFTLYIVVGIWIGAGLGEELLIRGFILNHLKEALGNSRLSWTLAIIGQAVIFGSMHGYQGSVGIVATGLTGLSFGILYIATNRKLFPLIVAHNVFNTLFLFAAYATGEAG